jgi:hypothetical protein
VLLDAIDISLSAIEGRARLYRNLVVAVSVVSVLSILMAVLFPPADGLCRDCTS